MFVAGQGVCSGGGWITGRSDTQQLLTVLLTQRSRVIVFVRSVTSAAWSPSRVRGGTVGTVRRTTRSISAPAAPTCETFLLRHQIRKGQKRSMANVIKSHVESNECPPQDVVSIPHNGKCFLFYFIIHYSLTLLYLLYLLIDETDSSFFSTQNEGALYVSNAGKSKHFQLQH